MNPASTTKSERVHRFALSISGGIALGSYEAGVLTQLYRDLTAFNAHPDIKGKARVLIDAIAGASAGSITGLILAQSIALGRTPDELEQRMRACWVELLDIHNLLKPSASKETGSAIFTDTVVDEVIAAAVDTAPQPPQQPNEPIALWITMTNLDGIPYVIDFKRKDSKEGKHYTQANTELYALDYKDYIPFLISGSTIQMIEPRMGAADGRPPLAPAAWQDAVEAARASAAFPVAFASRNQMRNLTQYPEYQKFKQQVETTVLPAKADNPGLQPVAPLPDSAVFQFVDGGLFNNEPIGKCIDAAGYLNQQYPVRDPNNHTLNQGKAGRSFVIIEPEPQLPADVERALAVSSLHSETPMLPHSLLAKILSAYFNSALYGDFQTAAEINDRIYQLDQALQALDTLGLDANTVQTLKDNIKKAVKLEKKTEITLQRIPSNPTTSNRLAGAFAGHFGGFLRRDFREADFITGQWEARQWFVKWLALWMQNHADDLGKNPNDMTEDYAATLLGAKLLDLREVTISPTNLTPVELASSGWFPVCDKTEGITDTARLAALTAEERTEIIQLAEARGEALVDAWLHVSPLGHFGVHIALGAVEHLLNARFIDEPDCN